VGWVCNPSLPSLLLEAHQQQQLCFNDRCRARSGVHASNLACFARFLSYVSTMTATTTDTTAATKPEDFPDLTEADHKLLELYFRPGMTMTNMAHHLAIPLLELARRLAAPSIRHAIALITQAATQRARDLAAANSPIAMSTMVSVARDNWDSKPETARKAAAAILRAAAPPKLPRPPKPTPQSARSQAITPAQPAPEAMPRAA
jgi:alkylhydroperoxidase/carboxymuconolactone decarboxylase family protein YurZ